MTVDGVVARNARGARLGAKGVGGGRAAAQIPSANRAGYPEPSHRGRYRGKYHSQSTRARAGGKGIRPSARARQAGWRKMLAATARAVPNAPTRTKSGAPGSGDRRAGSRRHALKRTLGRGAIRSTRAGAPAMTEFAAGPCTTESWATDAVVATVATRRCRRRSRSKQVGGGHVHVRCRCPGADRRSPRRRRGRSRSIARSATRLPASEVMIGGDRTPAEQGLGPDKKLDLVHAQLAAVADHTSAEVQLGSRPIWSSRRARRSKPAVKSGRASPASARQPRPAGST